jgi:hypothetical protein
VAGCIIAKLPPSWRNFATALKHKRQEISVENLIASLDVEEKAHAKDTTVKGEGHATTNFVQQKGKSSGKNKGNFKPLFNKPIKTTTFKKKKPSRDMSDLTFSLVESPTTFPRTAQNMQTAEGKRPRLSTSSPLAILMGMVNYLLFFWYFNLPLGGLIQVLTFMCVLISLCSILTRPHGIPPS